MSKKLLKIFIITFLIFSAIERLSFIVTADNLYRVIDSSKSESSRKVMYTNSIAVDANITESDLRQILDKAAKEFGDKIKNYKQPTKQSVVYAYLSEQAYRDDKGSWVGMAFWIVGEGEVRIDINKEKLQSAHQENVVAKSMPLNSANEYPGVFGPDSNFRTKAILPLERQVYDALKKEFDLNPEPDSNRFVSDDAWIDACDTMEDKCIKKVAKDFNISERTVKDIWWKVGSLKH